MTGRIVGVRHETACNEAAAGKIYDWWDRVGDNTRLLHMAPLALSPVQMIS